MWKINLKLLPLKLLLFFLFAAIGCLPAFLTIHMFHIGLTLEEVTWINTVLPLTALAGPPLVGYLADSLGHYRLITISAMFLAGLLHTSLLFVPERATPQNAEMKLVCSKFYSTLKLKSCDGTCPSLNASTPIEFRIGNCVKSCERFDFCGKADKESKRIHEIAIPDEIADSYSGDAFNITKNSRNPSILARNSREIFSNSRRPDISIDPGSDTFEKSKIIIREIPVFNPEAQLYEDIKFLSNESSINICLRNETGVYCDEMFPYSFIQTHLNLMKSSGEFLTTRDRDCCDYHVDTNYNVITCSAGLESEACDVICDIEDNFNETDKTSILREEKCLPADSNPQVTFWVYFILRTLAELFPAVLISLFDAVALSMVAQHGGDYGRQKMFGLFAVGTSAPIVGYLLDRKIGVHGRFAYAPVFYVFDAFLLIAALITLTLPIKINTKRGNMLKNMVKLIKTSEFNVLILIVILLGAFNGYLETFLYVYMLKDLSATNFLLGLTITVGIVPSVPFLYKSDAIVNFCGHHYLLMLAFVAYSIRFAGLSYIVNPLWVLPLEVLELFTLNLMQVTAVLLAYKLAPKNLIATAQGLVWIANFDIGRAIGTVIGGYLIHHYGDVKVFRIACIFSICCAIVYFAIFHVVKFCKIKSTATVRDNEESIAETQKLNGPLSVSNGKCVPLADAEDLSVVGLKM